MLILLIFNRKTKAKHQHILLLCYQWSNFKNNQQLYFNFHTNIHKFLVCFYNNFIYYLFLFYAILNIKNKDRMSHAVLSIHYHLRTNIFQDAVSVIGK